MRSVAIGVTLGAMVGLTGCGESTAVPSGTGSGSGTTLAAIIYGTNPTVGVGELSVLANGSISATNSIGVPGLATPSGPFLQGIAVDSTGEIFVGERLTSGTSQTGAVMVFAAGAGASANPVRTIVGTNTQLKTPSILTVDAAGDVYVAQLLPGDVLEFAAGASGNVAPVRTLKGSGAANTGIGGVLGMGVDANGNLYVANDIGNINNILVFGPTSNGDVAPIRTIEGNATVMIGNTLGVAVDAAGNIYVSTESIIPPLRAILEFAAGSNGNVAPIREITGSNTALTGNLSTPVLDSSGNLYVLVGASGTVNLLKFTGDASGNAVPATVSGAGTGIESFQIALH